MTACDNDVNRVATVMCRRRNMANQAPCVESVDELAHIWIDIAFQMNVDIADGEQWIGKRDDAVLGVRQLVDKR